MTIDELLSDVTNRDNPLSITCIVNPDGSKTFHAYAPFSKDGFLDDGVGKTVVEAVLNFMVTNLMNKSTPLSGYGMHTDTIRWENIITLEMEKQKWLTDTM